MADCKSLKPSICGDRGITIPQDSCRSIRFEGVDDTEINQGACIDLTEGVHAYDGDGSEIPFTVSPSEIGCCDVGEHEITYKAVGKGNKMLPSFCIDKYAVHATDCGLMTKAVTRLVTVLQALPPKIIGAVRTIIAPSTIFDPLGDVSGIDDNGNETEVTYEGRYDVSAGEGEIVTFESDIEQNAKSVVVHIEPVQDGTGTPSPTNIRPISGWDEVKTYVSADEIYEVGLKVDYENRTFTRLGDAVGKTQGSDFNGEVKYTTSLGRTVYGGTLDVVSGMLTVDRGYIASYNGETLPSTWTSDRDVYASGTTPSIGAEVVYKLSTPQTYQLTPQEVRTLLGTNNVWSDAGTVEIVYSKPIGGATQFDIKGVYPITYHTEDECGNETTVTRELIVANCDEDSYEPRLCHGKLCCASLDCNTTSSIVCEATACNATVACEQTEITPTEA